MCLYTPKCITVEFDYSRCVCGSRRTGCVHDDAHGSSGRTVMMTMAIAVAVARVCGNECSGDSRHIRGDQNATNTHSKARYARQLGE